MYWSSVVVQLLIIAVISNDSFPIELKEIEPDDIDLVDKERKGRFIQVNQTTLLPNPVELIRAKKSSQQNVKEPDEENVAALGGVIKVKEKQSSTQETNPPTTVTQQPIHEGELLTHKNYTCSDSLFEPYTFGYPSFFEDHFKAFGYPDPAYPSNPMVRMPRQMQMQTDDNCCNCCNIDTPMSSFTSNFPCIEEYVVPEVNLFCY